MFVIIDKDKPNTAVYDKIMYAKDAPIAPNYAVPRKISSLYHGRFTLNPGTQPKSITLFNRYFKFNGSNFGIAPTRNAPRHLQVRGRPADDRFLQGRQAAGEVRVEARLRRYAAGAGTAQTERRQGTERGSPREEGGAAISGVSCRVLHCPSPKGF